MRAASASPQAHAAIVAAIRAGRTAIARRPIDRRRMGLVGALLSAWIAADARWKAGDKGALVGFTYVDADGVVTRRKLRGWASKGPLIVGYCVDRQKVRAFRKDRISDWVELE
ncbi:hypothetical protein [Stakelama tenebrarum]|uniref:WYL domain-containing protein n=1 Tax=Stakelama tenebrarum TaxID=2711215 RepID=A0A6G6Y681_9SPHN|nr:hypothetical protein [Sphingosinithalassobacter tenebrarum]QIG80086.1 hypothetical protein G5C33_10040 [Sphingosinithalassobacter tenebrarum]